MIIGWLDTIIGSLPTYATAQDPTRYYEIIRYIIAGGVLMFLISAVYRLFFAIFGRWTK